MTPLKPIENTTRVRAVASTRYPLNTVCAHPECNEPVNSGHHIFGRQPGENGDSWFVELPAHQTWEGPAAQILPHVTGLCGSGTTKHHGDLEEHRSWIKLEDGVFVWYDRKHVEGVPEAGEPLDEWVRLGPLNPQPGSVEGKPKRKPRNPNAGPVKVVSFKAPQDDLEAAERIKEKTQTLLERFERAGHKIGKTVAVERALDFTLLNAGPDDI